MRLLSPLHVHCVTNDPRDCHLDELNAALFGGVHGTLASVAARENYVEGPAKILLRTVQGGALCTQLGIGVDVALALLGGLEGQVQALGCTTVRDGHSDKAAEGAQRLLSQWARLGELLEPAKWGGGPYRSCNPLHHTNVYP